MASKQELDDILRNWAHLNEAIMAMEETQVTELLEHEKQHKGRLRIMMRLYNRMSKLRAAREKVELSRNARA